MKEKKIKEPPVKKLYEVTMTDGHNYTVFADFFIIDEGVLKICIYSNKLCNEYNYKMMACFKEWGYILELQSKNDSCASPAAARKTVKKCH